MYWEEYYGTLISNILSVHRSIYRHIFLWLEIDLDKGVLTGYYGTYNKENKIMRILRLELKRMLKARLTWILLSLVLVFSILLAYLPVTYCYSSYTDENGNEIHLTGLKSIA